MILPNMSNLSKAIEAIGRDTSEIGELKKKVEKLEEMLSEIKQSIQK